MNQAKRVASGGMTTERFDGMRKRPAERKSRAQARPVPEVVETVRAVSTGDEMVVDSPLGEALSVQAVLTVKEAAFVLGKSADTIYRWLRRGRLTGLQPGGRGCSIYVGRESVTAALQQRAGAAARFSEGMRSAN